MKTFRSLLILGFLSLLAACQPATPPAMPLPDLRIGVAPFTQPVQPTQLLAGYIPSTQGLAAPENLLLLDNMLEEKLTATGRPFVFLKRDDVLHTLAQEAHGRRGALPAWVQVGRMAGVDLLLVPQIIDWHERDGRPAGVTSPASVVEDYFLIDVRDPKTPGALLKRSHFDQRQQALTSNLLTLGEFLQRGAKWVTASELSGEAMAKAVKELGL